MAKAVIRTEKLTKIYKSDLGQKPITGVEDLNLEIQEGEVYAFLGPNGAGKTTTIKMLTRLIFPSRGKIWIRDHLNDSREAMKSVGYMPEQPNLYGYLTGAEFMDFIARIFGIDSGTRKKRIPELLDKVGLSGKGKQLIRSYSRGMIQRLAMAQALINDPDVLILDEPMSALDPIGRKDFRDLILELKKQGKTLFFSSHILSDAEMISDRVGILNQGRLTRSGKLDELIGSQIISIEVTFSIESGPVSPQELGIDGAVVQDRKVLVRLSREEDLPSLLQTIEKHRGKLISIVPIKKNLEDLFLSEVGR